MSTAAEYNSTANRESNMADIVVKQFNIMSAQTVLVAGLYRRGEWEMPESSSKLRHKP